MELHQVRYFLAVFEARNFTRAAERCRVSQPALTRAIKKLEDELGGPLFHRERDGAKLTTLGEMVLPGFTRLAEDTALIADMASRHRLLKQVPVRVGVLCTIGPQRLAARLDAFHRAAPDVELELRMMRQRPLLERLEDATLELAIGNEELAVEEWLVVRRLYEERYVVALPPGHALADNASIALVELRGQPYIDRLACELRDMVAAAASARRRGSSAGARSWGRRGR